MTFCPHGISHQPGEPVGLARRSIWCGECFPDDAAVEEIAECGCIAYDDGTAIPCPAHHPDARPIEATHNERYRAWQIRQSCERPTMWGQS
jgi:hypothetical protein